MEIVWEKSQLQRKTWRMLSNQPQMAPHLLDSLTCFLEKNGQLSSPLFPPKASCKIAKSLGEVSPPHPKKRGALEACMVSHQCRGNSPSSLLFVISKAGDFDSRLSPPEHRILGEVGGEEKGKEGQRNRAYCVRIPKPQSSESYCLWSLQITYWDDCDFPQDRGSSPSFWPLLSPHYQGPLKCMQALGMAHQGSRKASSLSSCEGMAACLKITEESVSENEKQHMSLLELCEARD